MKRYWKWIAVFLLFILGFFLMIKKASKPLPGDLIEDLGRNHVTDIYGIAYNSNPPTSGPHFPIWAKGGIYDRPISDGYLIHSLEHGYVIISYDCTKKTASLSDLSLVKTASAHEEGEGVKDATDSGTPLMHMDFVPKTGESWMTSENPPEAEIKLPNEFNSDSCKSFAERLSQFAKGGMRVIVIPRAGMDVPIALTAWRRILKLDEVDEEKITEFIKAYHDKGPEQTME